MNHGGRRGASISAIALVAVLSGCAAVAPAPPLTYLCEGGSEFRLTVAPSGDGAAIEISGMRFHLQAESSGNAGERFACSQLSVWREGEQARLQMADSNHPTRCRLKH